MKTRHTKKWVVEHLVKDSSKKGINGYMPYEETHLFTDGCGFLAFLNDDYGFAQSEKQFRNETIKDMANRNRPNKHAPVTDYSAEYEHVTVNYEKLLKLNDAMECKAQQFGDAWYNPRYILWACELMNNRWNKDGEFELYYMKGNSLRAAWFFDENQAICILPVRHS